jgi:hypothetical protein
VGVQFHTEKSGRAGLELIARFGRWDGSVEGVRAPAAGGAC